MSRHDVHGREFDHRASAWTVGDLRLSLVALPDDMPLTVLVAEIPGGGGSIEQVVVGGEPRSGDADTDSCFVVSAEYPSGHYIVRGG